MPQKRIHHVQDLLYSQVSSQIGALGALGALGDVGVLLLARQRRSEAAERALLLRRLPTCTYKLQASSAELLVEYSINRVYSILLRGVYF
jgi:hypothetical protein